mmetsp:Transcript_54353/g.80615  ORF Transcript_54353/g.80615 Transcript_54353/m.80615 type:complete len:120 (-) Transcript_54353:73-432(-)|eukprot:CAMPEP_0195533680 /NCGR_PEP_ID=MMETSP0794_2-20130614/40991_1 /TAXON_ID=515487 /ORGANISM="Stephanopyxis turris, Strain CCMP 815" /LENGTH=119 /DNA_ID=CAMNT_0040666301 /DNA_START=38 /DNA_END=397 /DNA_ORIENTATION=-
MSVSVEIAVAGDGLTYPKRGQVVTIHYTATTTSPKGDGAMVEFDSTHKRGKPLSFRLGSEQVVPGLEEGVAQLSVGDRAKITIPPTKGYGKKGFPGLIAPNAEMVFDVEMLSCVDVSED